MNSSTFHSSTIPPFPHSHIPTFEKARLGEIEEERRTGNVVSTIAALFSKREEEDDAAEEKVRAVESQTPNALPVQLERGDSRVAMSVLAALKDGAKKPAQLRETLGIKSAPFFTLTYLKPLAADGLIEMTNPASPNSPQQSYRLPYRERGPALNCREAHPDGF